jgi:hypothetical protein
MRAAREIQMRSNVYDSMPVRLCDVPPRFSASAVTYREVLPSSTRDRARAHATVLAGLMLLGLAGLAFVGLISLVGAVGFGIWQLWS